MSTVQKLVVAPVDVPVAVDERVLLFYDRELNRPDICVEVRILLAEVKPVETIHGLLLDGVLCAAPIDEKALLQHTRQLSSNSGR